MRLLVLALLVAVAAVVALVALLATFQERVVWQPPAAHRSATMPASAGRIVSYAAADGQRLIGYLVTPRIIPLMSDAERPWIDSLQGELDDTTRRRLRARVDSSQRARSPYRWNGRVLVAFHGNAEIAAWRTAWAHDLAARSGWTVLVPEYRGYAGLPGRPSYAGSQADARAAYAFVRDSLGVPPDRIGIHGFSLGTAVATELASEVGPSVLILEAPFTSARDMARASLFPPMGWLWRWIARVHFDTRARVADLDAPVWVIHGGNDMIIPVRMGRAVHAAARVPGEYVEIPGAGHNDLASSGRDAYWRWLERALRAGAAAADQPPSASQTSP